MKAPNFESERCQRIGQNLDAYLRGELPAEAQSQVRHHLETCEACKRELEVRTRLRKAVRLAVESQIAPDELRLSIQRRLRQMQPEQERVRFRQGLVAALVAGLCLLLGAVGIRQLLQVQQGRRLVEGVLALGVSDHIQCAIKGHNYPEVANPPDQLREKLGPQYSGLLAVVQQHLPGFEILEAHICSIPGSPRKYIHFITRGRGTILSVILTRREGEHLPGGGESNSGASAGVRLFEAHLQGMNAAGFESKGYWGFVVSDLNRDATLQIARELAPPLKSSLEAGEESPARLNLGADPSS